MIDSFFVRQIQLLLERVWHFLERKKIVHFSTAVMMRSEWGMDYCIYLVFKATYSKYLKLLKHKAQWTSEHFEHYLIYEAWTDFFLIKNFFVQNLSKEHEKKSLFVQSPNFPFISIPVGNNEHEKFVQKMYMRTKSYGTCSNK